MVELGCSEQELLERHWAEAEVLVWVLAAREVVAREPAAPFAFAIQVEMPYRLDQTAVGLGLEEEPEVEWDSYRREAVAVVHD